MTIQHGRQRRLLKRKHTRCLQLMDSNKRYDAKALDNKKEKQKPIPLGTTHSLHRWNAPNPDREPNEIQEAPPRKLLGECLHYSI